MPLTLDSVSRTMLHDLAVSVLLAANTDAGTSVFAPRDWPEDPSMFPALAVQTPTERKEALTRGPREFTTMITLAVMVRVTSDSAGDTDVALERLCFQVEDAILSSVDIMLMVQQIARVETSMVVEAGGEGPIGEAAIIFDCEVFQVYVTADVPLTDIALTFTDQSTGNTLAVVDAAPFQDPLSAAAGPSLTAAGGGLIFADPQT